MYNIGEYGKARYTCDTEADIADLPTDRTPGSSAYVISTSDTYRLNSQGRWVKQVRAAGSSSGGTDIYIESAQLDESDNLILSFNVGDKEPVKVNLGSINSLKLQQLQEEIDNNKIELADESAIDKLFEKEG